MGPSAWVEAPLQGNGVLVLPRQLKRSRTRTTNMHNDPPPDTAAIYPALAWLMLAQPGTPVTSPGPLLAILVKAFGSTSLPGQLGRGEASTNLAAPLDSALRCNVDVGRRKCLTSYTIVTANLLSLLKPDFESLLSDQRDDLGIG